MATKTTSAKKPATTTADKAHATRVALLQKTLNGCEDSIIGKARSLTSRAIKCRSIAPNIVEAMFTRLEERIQAGRDEYAAAQRGDDVGAIARLDLGKL